jgi:hypothetical protein
VQGEKKGRKGLIDFRIVAALGGGVLAAGLTIGLKGSAGVEGVTLEVAGRSSANVSLAAHGAFVAAAWSASEPKGTTDVFAAVSHDSGKTFSTPTRVNSTAGDARVNGEQPPRVALLPRASRTPAMTVVWTSRNSVGNTLLWARSEDGGRTFSPSTLVPGGEAAGNRGWQSVAVDANGAVRVLWLDHRELASKSGGTSGGHVHHAGHDPGKSTRDAAASAERSKLYFATVGDADSARMLLGGVCYCCKTALASASDQTIYAAWRHVYAGNLRDIAFAASRDRGRTFDRPVRVSEDKWALDGCPDDGPAMTVDESGGVHLVWPTLVTDGAAGQPSIGLFHASSRDGRTFGARRRLPTEGVPHHPQASIARGVLYFAWDEMKGGSRQVVVAHGRSSEADTRFQRVVVSGAAAGVYPSLAPIDGGVVVAWGSSGDRGAVIRVRPLAAP